MAYIVIAYIVTAYIGMADFDRVEIECYLARVEAAVSDGSWIYSYVHKLLRISYCSFKLPFISYRS